MAIISFSRSALIDYVPVYGGNRKSENPCIVKTRFVSHARTQEYSRIISTRTKNIADMERKTEILYEIQKKQFCENVESISGYSVDGVEVTSAEEFYDTADTELVAEIIQAMQSSSQLSEGQRKN